MSKTPYFVLFLGACVAQLAIPVWMIVDRELILRQGEEFKFKAEPVDPYDPFRGRYVRLRLSPSTAPAPDESIPYGKEAFAHIEVDEDGFVQFSALSLDPPENVPYIKVRTLGIVRTFDASPPQPSEATRQEDVSPQTRLTLPFDRYYMEEKLAPQAERAYIEATRRGAANTYVTVRIRSGSAVLEELYLDGKPIRESIAEDSS